MTQSSVFSELEYMNTNFNSLLPSTSKYGAAKKLMGQKN